MDINICPPHQRPALEVWMSCTYLMLAEHFPSNHNSSSTYCDTNESHRGGQNFSSLHFSGRSKAKVVNHFEFTLVSNAVLSMCQVKCLKFTIQVRHPESSSNTYQEGGEKERKACGNLSQCSMETLESLSTFNHIDDDVECLIRIQVCEIFSWHMKLF